MAKIIRNGKISNDGWCYVDAPEGETSSAIVPPGRVIVPLALWLAQRDALLARGDVGVALQGSDDPAALADDLGQLPLVAIHFPKFTDGRGYSSATLLRSRYGYSGELRAYGEVLRDQFNYLLRCGFDVLQPQAERYNEAQLEAAIASLADFSEPYQGTVTPSQPLFRRIRRAA